MKCCICQKGPNDVSILYRVNAKGVPGIWACAEHIRQTDGVVPLEISDIVAALDAKESEQ